MVGCGTSLVSHKSGKSSGSWYLVTRRLAFLDSVQPFRPDRGETINNKATQRKGEKERKERRIRSASGEERERREEEEEIHSDFLFV